MAHFLDLVWTDPNKNSYRITLDRRKTPQSASGLILPEGFCLPETFDALDGNSIKSYALPQLPREKFYELFSHELYQNIKRLDPFELE